MNRQTLLQQLTRAEEQIGQGELYIRRQHEIIDGIQRAGGDVDGAQALLRTYETARALHMSERHRFLRELNG